MDKRKVMVVDDEPDFLLLTKATLEQTGKYEVLILSDAKDIIQNARDFKPDIILLDVRMPMVGGIEACEMLNQDFICRNIPIIVCSILESDRDKLKAYKVGVVDYLPKSAGKEELIVRIGKALESKQTPENL